MRPAMRPKMYARLSMGSLEYGDNMFRVCISSVATVVECASSQNRLCGRFSRCVKTAAGRVFL